MDICKEEIELKPAFMEDRSKIYQWMASSNITSFLFDKEEIPTWEEFLEDYQDFYFDGTAPEKGGGFIIVYKEIPIGFISYASFHLAQNKTELDIWMSGQENCEKGIGSKVIRMLCDYLMSDLEINEFLIIPSINNPRAIRAYEKAGFERVSKGEKIEIMKKSLREDFLKESHDYDHIYSDEENLLLIKKL